MYVGICKYQYKVFAQNNINYCKLYFSVWYVQKQAKTNEKERSLVKILFTTSRSMCDITNVFF